MTPYCWHGCVTGVHHPIRRSVRIATRKNPKHPSQLLSMGFGFVEFKYERHALEAIRALQGRELDGHALALKRSRSKRPTASQRERQECSGVVWMRATQPLRAEQGHVIKPKGTKLLVKNIPFEATKREVRDIFAAIGQIRSVRMPSKFDGSHRGYACMYACVGVCVGMHVCMHVSA
jgi:multiple RNA-binding domain-containing protein 1